MILDDFWKTSLDDIFGFFFLIFFVCPILANNGGFGRRFLRGIGFFTNSGLRGTPLTFYFQKF